MSYPSASYEASGEIKTDTWFDRVRERNAQRLGVSAGRKEQLYIEILKSASLRDVSYWLQVFFAAGIATLGLVLNSVAVIIGAMLISPLMNPILASGLALAAGDLILGIRALLNLCLSCLLAIGLAVVLVTVLPFKEITSEIAARTQPNTLDLVVALFSGAVGSVAICREVKGVVTSIPGVAIAVALMPPLCVTGFGFGLALSSNAAEGLRVAQGGGLLFLTNFVAITFTAMLIFMLLHIDTAHVKERVREWREHDVTSRKVRLLLKRLPGYQRLKLIGSLPARVILTLLMVSLLLVPLSQAFSKLKIELTRKQHTNLVRKTATDLWQKEFAQLPDGTPRCFLGSVTAEDRNGVINLAMRVFTNKPYTVREESDYAARLAARLRLKREQIALNLIEIPTATRELEARSIEAHSPNATETVAPNLADAHGMLQQAIADALTDFALPAPAAFVGYEVTTRQDAPLNVKLGYVSSREISSDARELLAQDLSARLKDADTNITFEWLPREHNLLAYKRNQLEVTDEQSAQLELLARALQRYPGVRLELTVGTDRTEQMSTVQTRTANLQKHFNDQWQIAPARLSTAFAEDLERKVTATLVTQSAED